MILYIKIMKNFKLVPQDDPILKETMPLYVGDLSDIREILP